MFCSKCKGIRNFSGEWVYNKTFKGNSVVYDFIEYTCRDCQKGVKIFCIHSGPIDEKGNGFANKKRN